MSEIPQSTIDAAYKASHVERFAADPLTRTRAALQAALDEGGVVLTDDATRAALLEFSDLLVREQVKIVVGRCEELQEQLAELLAVVQDVLDAEAVAEQIGIPLRNAIARLRRESRGARLVTRAQGPD